MQNIRGAINGSPGREGGFTLLEILIVITILGILASLVAIRVMDRPGEARTLKAELDIKTLENAMKLSTEQGIGALVEKPSVGRISKNWRDGGYLEKGVVPEDPWGNDYLYLSPGINNKDFDLFSYGADGEEGGEGEDADVTNWSVKRE